MRIAYFAYLRQASHKSGVLRKICRQAKLWQQAGHTVKLFLLSTINDNPNLPVEGQVYICGSALGALLNADGVLRDVIAWQPDLLYSRFSVYYPSLERVSRHCPIVWEVNSDDRQETPLTMSKVQQLYHRLTRWRLLQLAAGFVFVSAELQQRFAVGAVAQTVIANGIDFSGYPEPQPPANALPVRLAFIGSANQPWHGLDKLAELARMFPQWQFDIIGITASDTDISTANMNFYGPMALEQYLPLLQNAHVGIGTLALHRAGLTEASPLKVREYLALGLPVIIAYRDTDFTVIPPFMLDLTAEMESLSQCQVRIAQFVQNWVGIRVPRGEVAIADAGNKEQQRLKFFAEIVKC